MAFSAQRSAPRPSPCERTIERELSSVPIRRSRAGRAFVKRVIGPGPSPSAAHPHRLEMSPKTSGAVSCRGATAVRRNGMKRDLYSESTHSPETSPATIDAALATSGLPRRLMTAFEVAKFVGCHEETVRRAYLRGLLASQRFGVRGRRFHPTDVLDWIRRGLPTRPLRSPSVS